MVMNDSGGDETDLDRVLAEAVGRLPEAVLQHVVVVARAHGLSVSDLRALWLVHRGRALRPGELARALDMSASGVTGVIGRLVRAGLPERDAGPANRHDVRLQATQAGVDLLPLARGRQVREAGELLDLGEAERTQMVGFLLALVGLVERETEAAWLIASRLAASRSRDVPSPPRWA
jgi:DNA-binding MarR family transcriptional regulator